MGNLDVEIRFRISDEDKGKAEDVANNRGLNLSSYVRSLVLIDIKKNK